MKKNIRFGLMFWWKSEAERERERGKGQGPNQERRTRGTAERPERGHVGRCRGVVARDGHHWGGNTACAHVRRARGRAGGGPALDQDGGRGRGRGAARTASAAPKGKQVRERGGEPPMPSDLGGGGGGGGDEKGRIPKGSKLLSFPALDDSYICPLIFP